MILLSYIQDQVIPAVYGERLGDFGIPEIIMLVILIVGTVIGAGIGIASAVVDARKKAQAGRVVAAAEQVAAQAASIEGEAAGVESATKKEKTTVQVALAGVLGIAGIAAAVSFLT